MYKNEREEIEKKMIDIAHGFIDLHKRDKSDSDYLIEWGHHSCSHMSKGVLPVTVRDLDYARLQEGHYKCDLED